jgi:hypothetical protein
MARSDSQKSFQKALYLGIFFVVVLVVANSLMKIVSHSMNPLKAAVDAANANIKMFDEGDKVRIKKKIAGFWQCNGVKSDEYPFLSVSDRFELKDNGIFWRVRRDVAHLPSGDSIDFVNIMTGYSNPYSMSKTCQDSMSCQVHFIGQVVIAGKDTCYVEHARMPDDPKKSIMPEILRAPQRQQDEGMVDTVWDIVANGKIFGFEGRPYSKFDTSGPALHSFFPAGATKLVGRISIDRCRESVSLEQAAKHAIVKDFASVSVPLRTQQDILEIIGTYYKDIGAVNVARSATRFGTGTVTLSFSVTPQGAVVGPDVASAKPWNMRLNNELKKELGTWIFPKCTSQQTPLSVLFSFHY